MSKISVVAEDGQWFQVEGHPLPDKLFAVNQSEGHWVATHLGTGAAMVYCRSREAAEIMAAAYSSAGDRDALRSTDRETIWTAWPPELLAFAAWAQNASFDHPFTLKAAQAVSGMIRNQFPNAGGTEETSGE